MCPSREICFEFENDPTLKSEICSTVLKSLPEWFGIPEALENYCSEVRNMTFLNITCKDGTSAGFIAVKIHFDFNAELYVLGIKREFHKKGIGTRALKYIEEYLKEQDIPFMSVKTLSPSRESDEYEKTRKFYEKCGFRPFEEFKELWGVLKTLVST